MTVDQGYNPNENSAGRTLNGRCYNNRSYSFLYFWELSEVMAWLQWNGCFISVLIKGGRVGANQSGGLWKVHEWRGKTDKKKKKIGQLKQNRMSTRSPYVKSGSRVLIGNGIPGGAVGAFTGLWASIIQVSNVADFWFLAWFLTGLLRARADGPSVVASCLSDFVTVV